MTLLIGTYDGIYRADGVPFDTVEQVFDTAVTGVRNTSTGVLAYGDGIYRSNDGRTWEELDAPQIPVTSITEGADGLLYAGAGRPAQLFVSPDGSSWQQTNFPQLSPVVRWFPGEGGSVTTHPDGGLIKAVGTHVDNTDLVIVGVEPQGVFISEDHGKTWEKRSYGLQHDVHALIIQEYDTWLAACGGGLYETYDAGVCWVRLDTSQALLEYNFFHDAVIHDSRLYTAAAKHPPGTFDDDFASDTVILESDDGQHFEFLHYPGGPQEYVCPFTVYKGEIIAGTVAQDPDMPGTTEAKIIRRAGHEWETAGYVPAGVISLGAL